MNATESAFDDLLGTRWVPAGSTASGADCLGIVNLCLERRGLPRLDVWSAWRPVYVSGWRNFHEAAPEGWRMVSKPSQQDDVVVMFDEAGVPGGVGYVDDTGGIITSVPGAGAVRRTIRSLRERIESVWRHECLSA